MNTWSIERALCGLGSLAAAGINKLFNALDANLFHDWDGEQEPKCGIEISSDSEAAWRAAHGDEDGADQLAEREAEEEVSEPRRRQMRCANCDGVFPYGCACVGFAGAEPTDAEPQDNIWGSNTDYEEALARQSVLAAMGPTDVGPLADDRPTSELLADAANAIHALLEHDPIRSENADAYWAALISELDDRATQFQTIEQR